MGSRGVLKAKKIENICFQIILKIFFLKFFFNYLPRATPGSSAFYIIFMLLYFYYFTCVLMILRIVHPRTFIYDCPKKAKGMLRTFRSVLWNWFYYFTVGDMFSFLVLLTLSLLGYLKTRICWGGQFNPPPSKSHV